jgi:hypothetical protein
MTTERERTLDDEGVPDLEGPLPEKAATGDPQEGLAPPNEAPQSSVDRRTVPAEERRDETVDERLRREEPDVDAPTPQPREQVQTADPQGTREDTEKDAVADEAPVEGALDPEEQAMRVESTEEAEEER